MAEIDAMFERMQTQSFAAAVRRVLDEPLRVPVSERWTREARRNRIRAETGAQPQKKSQP